MKGQEVDNGGITMRSDDPKTLQARAKFKAKVKAKIDTEVSVYDESKVSDDKSVVGKDGYVNNFDIYGQTKLHNAAYEGKIHVIQRLILVGADVNIKECNQGDSPLHKAVHGGHIEVVTLLLNYGVTINVVNKDGETPLHYAAYNGAVEIMRLLIGRGGDILIESRDGANVLHQAVCCNSNVPIFKKAAMISILCGSNPELVNAPNHQQYKETPLHWAVYEGNTSSIIDLRACGAGVDVEYGFGSPLMKAREYGIREEALRPSIISALIKPIAEIREQFAGWMDEYHTSIEAPALGVSPEIESSI